MSTAVITALGAEGRTLRPRSGIRCRVGGVGARAAARAAEAALEEGAEALVSWGVAGGLTRELEAGMLIVPARVHTQGGRTHSCDPEWRRLVAAQLSEWDAVREGDLAEAAGPVASRQARAALHQRTGALGVDMESAAVAGVAAEAGVPFLAVRAVADTVRRPLPEAVLAACPDGVVRPLRAGAAVLRRPWELPGMVRLARDFGRALATLRAADARLDSGLALPGSANGGAMASHRTG